MKGSYQAHENLQNEIIFAIERGGFGFVWQNKTGQAWRDGIPVRFGLVGSSDIIGMLSNGRFIGIEVKTGNAKQTDQQKKFMARVIKLNGYFLVARDVGTVLQYVKEKLHGCTEISKVDESDR